MSDGEKAVKTTYFSIIGNTALALIKGVAGVLGNSYALIADAIESTTDIFSSLFVLLGLRYANKPADKNHPYGHGRVEPLITFVVVVFLITSATIIAYESIQHIRTPHKLPEPWTLYILGGIILWKEWSYRVVLKKSKETNSIALRADAWHHRSDAITSVTAFIGISIALFFGKGYETADDWAALIASAVIFYNSYRIFRPALGELMDEQNYENLIEQIRTVALTVNGVLATEKCYVRKSGMYYHIDLHAVVNGNLSVSEGHEIAHRLKDELMRKVPHLINVLVHIEPHTLLEDNLNEND